MDPGQDILAMEKSINNEGPDFFNVADPEYLSQIPSPILDLESHNNKKRRGKK
jgi:hypothetical protein